VTGGFVGCHDRELSNPSVAVGLLPTLP
jgi:hypothetical protein